MNLSVQQPTTMIKIRNHYTIDILEALEDAKAKQGIDFYNFEFNRKSSQGLLTTSVSDSSGHNETFESLPFINEEGSAQDSSFIKVPLDICPILETGIKENKKVAISELRTPKPHIKRGLNMNFVIDSLKFDLRVKNFSITPEYVLVFFFCKSDSMSFYRQYFNYLDLSFSTSCDWFSSSLSLKNPFEVGLENEFETKEVSIEDTRPFIEDLHIEEIYSRNRFEDRIAYFNQLKSSFSKADLKIMMFSLERGETSFVFTNTKELAVGSKSNKIMQDAIKIMSGEELEKIYENLEYDIVPISATKHGAYTIQTLLNYSTNNSHKKIISKYFEKEGEFLLAHEIGNYTFQKIISFDKQLISRFFLTNFHDVINSELGMKVFKRCFEHLEEYKEEFVKKIKEYKDLDMNVYLQFKQIVKNL